MGRQKSEEINWTEFKVPYFDSNVGKWIVEVSDGDSVAFYQHKTEEEATAALKEIFLNSVMKKK